MCVELLLAIQGRQKKKGHLAELLVARYMALPFGAVRGHRAPRAGIYSIPHREEDSLGGLRAGGFVGRSMARPHGSWGWTAVRNGSSSVFWGLMASLL